MSIPVEQVETFVAPLAAALRRQYAGVDVDDIRQELIEWFWANPRKATSYWNHENPAQGERMLGRALMNRGRRFCLQERARRGGYQYSDLAFYTADQLREELLPAVWDREAWASPPKRDRDEQHARRDPAEGSNWLASLADTADAYRRLPEQDRTLIELRYRDGLAQTRIAKVLGVSDSTVSEGLDRAVDRMVRLLGGERPRFEPDEIPVSSRRAVSNAAAQAMTRNLYDG